MRMIALPFNMFLDRLRLRDLGQLRRMTETTPTPTDPQGSYQKTRRSVDLKQEGSDCSEPS